MSENKIKFSHTYPKMPYPDERREAILLEVLVAMQKDLSPEFIDYDTTYYESIGSELIRKNYPLPKGKVLILLLNSRYAFKDNLWTTIRRWTPEKETYYRGLIGKTIKTIIEVK